MTKYLSSSRDWKLSLLYCLKTVFSAGLKCVYLLHYFDNMSNFMTSVTIYKSVLSNITHRHTSVSCTLLLLKPLEFRFSAHMIFALWEYNLRWLSKALLHITVCTLIIYGSFYDVMITLLTCVLSASNALLLLM